MGILGAHLGSTHPGTADAAHEEPIDPHYEPIAGEGASDDGYGCEYMQRVQLSGSRVLILPAAHRTSA